jgi:leucyl-tRNA synthetase
MELMNEMIKAKQAGAASSEVWKEALTLYALMLAPISPHMAEELWMKIGNQYSIHTQSWPEVDQVAAAEEELTLVVQVNGKLRDRITVPISISDEEAKKKALASDVVQKLLEGKQPRQVIVVPKRLVNIVI